MNSHWSPRLHRWFSLLWGATYTMAEYAVFWSKAFFSWNYSCGAALQGSMSHRWEGKWSRVWGRKYNKRMMTCDTDKVQTDLTPRTDVALKFHSWMPLFCGADQNWIWTDRSITEHGLGHFGSNNNNNKKKYLKGLHHISNGRTASSHRVSGADGAIFFWWILDEF